jgi:hypothetical protein
MRAIKEDGWPVSERATKQFFDANKFTVRQRIRAMAWLGIYVERLDGARAEEFRSDLVSLVRGAEREKPESVEILEWLVKACAAGPAGSPLWPLRESGT